MMKRWQRNIMRIVVISIAVILLLPALLYFPPVQHGVTRLAENWVAENTSMRISVGKFSLQFPLTISLHDFTLWEAEGDTILDASAIKTDIALMPLLKKRVEIAYITLQDVAVNYQTADSAMRAKVYLNKLQLDGGDIKLAHEQARIRDVMLDDADIELYYYLLPDTAEVDTTSMNWDVQVDNILFRNVAYTMYMPQYFDTLQVSLPQAYMQGGNISLGSNKVTVDTLGIAGGDYRYVAYSNAVRPQVIASNEPDTLPEEPMRISIANIGLNDNKVAYITKTSAPAEALDPSYILLDALSVDIDNVYYSGGEMGLSMRALSFIERCGLQLTQARGDIALDADGVLTVNNLAIATPQSLLDAQLSCDMGVLQKNRKAQVRLAAQAQLAYNDMLLIYPQSQHYFVHTYDKRKADYLAADVALHGTIADLVVERMDIEQPDVFALHSSAQCTNILNTATRQATLACELHTTPQLNLHNYIADSLMSHRITADPMRVDMRARVVGDSVIARVDMGCMGGAVDMSGHYHMQHERYKLDATVSQFPLSVFMPQQPIGNLSASMQLEGKHFSLAHPGLSLLAQLHIDTLQYSGYNYQDISLHAQVARQQWQLKADSRQRDVNVQLDAHGMYDKDFLVANVNAQIGLVDLAALNLSETPFDVAADIKGEVVLSNIDSIIQADVAVNHLIVGMDEYRYYANPITFLAASDITYSYMDIRTGDVAFNLSSDAGLSHMRPTLNRFSQLLDTIVQTQRLDMAELHDGLPPFVFSASIGPNNVIQRYLNSQGIRFSSAELNASNDSLFNIDGHINRLEVLGVTLDTISLDAHEQGNRLNYKLALDNRKGNGDEFAHAHIEGYLSGNSTRLYCIQNNRKNEVGFLFGCKVDFTPQQLQLTFGPQEPIIGYKKWQLNKDNFLTYNYGNRALAADVKLAYDNSHLFITTDDRRDHTVNGIHVDLKDVQLSDWLLSTPFISPMSGMLTADIYVDMPPRGMSVAGEVGMQDFVYNDTPVGTFNAQVDYEQSAYGNQDVNASVLYNGRDMLQAQVNVGAGEVKSIDGNIKIDALPLVIADAMITDKQGKISGEIDSEIGLSGTLNNPIAQGYIRTKDVNIALSQVGVDLSLDTTLIPIDNSRIKFSNYALRGANREPLKIDGVVDCSNLLGIGVDLTMTGRNFQPISMAANRTGMVYGQVFTDVDMKVNGVLGKMDIKGNIKVLPTTNATYIMQENTLSSGPDYSDMITFVSFADTLANKRVNEVRPYSSNTVSAEIDIEEGVQLNVFLSPDGNNSIDLVGGGNLLYLSTALGESRMLGRYALTEGYVRYTPPFMTQKIFNIREGSYVLWNGEVLNPYLDVNAVLSQRSTVKSGDETRLVDFDIIVMLRNTFENLDITFDLEVPEDINIQNELMNLSREQREAKAMNIFLYNSYNDLASATENSLVNTPLNTFLEYELNTWAQRTLKGVDLTFGIDNYGLDAAGTQRTDYSYQFSKSLFDNRLRVAVGGRYTSNQDVTENLKENLIDDISLEYRITRRDNMYVKAFRQRGYESIIEGEITQMGVGFLYRKQVASLLDLFRKSPKPAATSGETATEEADVESQPQEEDAHRQVGDVKSDSPEDGEEAAVIEEDKE